MGMFFNEKPVTERTPPQARDIFLALLQTMNYDPHKMWLNVREMWSLSCRMAEYIENFQTQENEKADSTR